MIASNAGGKEPSWWKKVKEKRCLRVQRRQENIRGHDQAGVIDPTKVTVLPSRCASVASLMLTKPCMIADSRKRRARECPPCPAEDIPAWAGKKSAANEPFPLRATGRPPGPFLILKIHTFLW
jgi:hypothetical protein